MWATRQRLSQRHSPAAFSALVSLVVAHVLLCGRGSLLVLHDDKPADIDPVAKDIIRRKARKLVGKAGLTLTDLPDLEHELSLQVLRRMSAFNPDRGNWAAFVTVVVTSWGSSLLRARYAAKRDHRRTRPLPVPTEPDERGRTGSEETPSQRGHDARLGRQSLDEQEQLELRLDVQAALDRLPPDLRPLADRLQHITIAELAREMGLPRTTLYELIERIRRRFQKMGLGKNP